MGLNVSGRKSPGRKARGAGRGALGGGQGRESGSLPQVSVPRAERQAPEVVPKVPAGQREALVTDDRSRGTKRRLREGGAQGRQARFV